MEMIFKSNLAFTFQFVNLYYTFTFYFHLIPSQQVNVNIR